MDDLRQRILHEIDTYEYVIRPNSVGNSWSLERVESQLADLRKSLVNLYAEKFELGDTFDEIRQPKAQFAEFFVVADDQDGNIVFYDPVGLEFGLAQTRCAAIPVTIGVRVDVVGVFMAR